MATDRVVEIEGDPWSVAKDVAHVLGYVQTDKAIRDHCRSAQRMAHPKAYPFPSGEHDMLSRS